MFLVLSIFCYKLMYIAHRYPSLPAEGWPLTSTFRFAVQQNNIINIQSSAIHFHFPIAKLKPAANKRNFTVQLS
jgi:hypothetical protein